MRAVRQTVRIHTGSSDEEGCLLFIDERLVAIFIRLSSEHNGLAGKWFLEHGFGPVNSRRQLVFDNLEAAESWVVSRLLSAGCIPERG